MKIISYEESSQKRVGLLDKDKVIDLNTSFTWAFPTEDPDLTKNTISLMEHPDGLKVANDVLEYALSQIREGKDKFVKEAVRSVDDINFLPPVLKPTKVIGAGMNYHSFVEALKEKTPEYPELFNKTSSALTGHKSPIVVPHVTNQAVPEGEIAVIIGKKGKFIPEEKVQDYIAGYTCANDISAKNLEFRASQWTAGKMLETFCPLGPALITRDEIADPNNISLCTFLNGTEIQKGNTSDMIFRIYRLISEISSCVTLEVGDVILTGTPLDLGEQSPPIFLQDGDLIEVSANGIGRLSNPVTMATSLRPTVIKEC